MFEPWMLAAIDQAGYNGISDRHIEAVADQLRRMGNKDIDRGTFERTCRACGIDPRNFNDEDLMRLENCLNGW